MNAAATLMIAAKRSSSRVSALSESQFIGVWGSLRDDAQAIFAAAWVAGFALHPGEKRMSA